MSYVPNKFYVGFKSESNDCLLGFMTPMANDSAFDKRKSTVDNWRDKKLKAAEVDNTPMTGFRFVDTARRGGRTNNVLFRVYHPAIGAEFEITAENLQDIISTCDVIKGEVQEKMLMVRDGAKNVLVPENGEIHLGSSQVDDNGKEIFLSKNEYKPSDLVTIKGSGKCVYLGNFECHGYDLKRSSSYNSARATYRVNLSSDKGNLVYYPEKDSFDIIKNLKVLKNLESTNYTVQDAMYAYDNSYYGIGILFHVGKLPENYKLVPEKSSKKSKPNYCNNLFDYNGTMVLGTYSHWNLCLHSLGEAVIDPCTYELTSTSSDGKFNQQHPSANATSVKEPYHYKLIVKENDENSK